MLLTGAKITLRIRYLTKAETIENLSISPPTTFTEICGDNIDNDFDGRVYESCPAPPTENG